MGFFKKVDKTVLFVSGAIAIFIIAWSFIATESFSTIFSTAFGYTLDKFGWLYIAVYTGIVIALLVLAFSKYGKIRLGKRQDEKPEYSTLLWIAMMFSAGQGVGLTFYGLYEPIDHFYYPLHAEPQSAQAMNEAISQSVFHFGLQPWGGYILVGLVVAYFTYNKKANGLLSTPLTYVWGKKNSDGSPRNDLTWGKVIDSYTVIISLMGICASLFLASDQLMTGLNHQFGLPVNTMTTAIMLGVFTVIFTISSGKGVSKGMAFLSNSNMKLCYTLLIGLLILGPTITILENLVQGIGTFLLNYVDMSFFLDANGGVKAKLGFDWMKKWTVFWWAYYMAWTPFVGIFVAKASRGRTIRELVLGGLILPSMYCYVWITFYGVTGLTLDQKTGGAIANATFANMSTSLYALYEQLPLGAIFSLITILVISTFILTSADSANYCVSVLTCRGEIDPPGRLRVFWGIIIGLFAGVFLLTGGVESFQNVQFLCALPLLIICILMFIAFLKTARKDYPLYAKPQAIKEERTVAAGSSSSV